MTESLDGYVGYSQRRNPDGVRRLPGPIGVFADLCQFLCSQLVAADGMFSRDAFKREVLDQSLREFKPETIALAGGSYVAHAPSSPAWLDGLSVRAEVAVVPNRRVARLATIHLEKKTDIVSTVVVENDWRLENALPVAHVALQWMRREHTDLLGRDLQGYRAPLVGDLIDESTGNFTPRAFCERCLVSKGVHEANYFVFALRQPLYRDALRLDFAMLADAGNGFLFQPGLSYRPASTVRFDVFANLISSPGRRHDTFTESLDFADEVFVRATWYFDAH